MADHRLETEAVLLGLTLMPLQQLNLTVKHTLKEKLKRLAEEDRRTLSAYVEKLLEDHVRSASQVDIEHRKRAKQRRAQ